LIWVSLFPCSFPDQPPTVQVLADGDIVIDIAADGTPLPDALSRVGGRYAQPWRLKPVEPEPLGATHAPEADRDDPHPPDRRKCCQIRSVFCGS
jgi:hypothetical protein